VNGATYFIVGIITREAFGKHFDEYNLPNQEKQEKKKNDFPPNQPQIRVGSHCRTLLYTDG
jgi:hypothetical protein